MTQKVIYITLIGVLTLVGIYQLTLNKDPDFSFSKITSDDPPSTNIPDPSFQTAVGPVYLNVYDPSAPNQTRQYQQIEEVFTQALALEGVQDYIQLFVEDGWSITLINSAFLNVYSAIRDADDDRNHALNLKFSRLINDLTFEYFTYIGTTYSNDAGKSELHGETNAEPYQINIAIENLQSKYATLIREQSIDQTFTLYHNPYGLYGRFNYGDDRYEEFYFNDDYEVGKHSTETFN